VPYSFVADSNHNRNYVADFLQVQCIHFLMEKAVLCFRAPLLGLRATYAVDLRLIGKLVVDFILVIIELFSLGAVAA